MQKKKHVGEERPEGTLKESETRYRRLFETTQDGILILDADTGEITDVNPFLVKMLGYSHEEFLGKQLWEIGAFKDIKESREAFQELEKNGYIRYDDLPLQARDGRRMDVEFVSNIYSVDHKRVIQCNIRDITKRKREDKEIWQLSKFPSENPNPVLRIARNGRILYANQTSAPILAAWGREVGQEVPGNWCERIESIYETGITAEVDLDCQGQIFSCFLTPNANEGYVNVYGRDITEHKRVEASLIKSEEFNRKLVEASPVAILYLDQDHKITYENPAMRRIMGVPEGSPSLVIGKMFFDLPPIKAALSEPISHAIMAGEAIQGEVIHYRSLMAKEVDLEVYTSPLKNAEGQFDGTILLAVNIIDRKQAEEALQFSEKRFRALIENRSDEISIIAADGTLLYESPSVNPTLGFGAGEFLGQSLFQLLHPDDLDLAQSTFTQLLQDASFQPREQFRLRHHDGTWRWVEAVGTNLLAEPSVGGILLNYHDITERKRAEEALRTSETLNRSLVEHLPQLIFVKDRQSVYITCNTNYARDLGISREEIVGKDDFAFFSSELAEGFQRDDQIVMDTGMIKDIEERYQVTGKEEQWNHTVKVPFHDEQGRVVGVLGIFEDITRRKQADETFKKLSSVVEQTADLVYITDQEGVIEYVNPAFEQLTGYTKEEAIGKTPRILKSGMQSAKQYEGLWETILAGKVLQGEMINRKKNGELYYEDKTITPIRDGQGIITHFVSTGKDITERMQRERELEAVANVSAALRAAKTLDEMLPLLLDVTLEVMHTTLGAIWLYDPTMDEMRPVVMRGRNEPGDNPVSPEKPGEGVNGYVYVSGQPYISRDFKVDLRLPESMRHLVPPDIGGAVIPIRVGENVIGTFNINVPLPRELIPADIRLLTTLCGIAGNAIQRTRSYEKTQRDAQRFAALHSIDVAISGSVDLRPTLNFLLGQVVDLLNVSAADVLLLNPHSLTLEYSAGKGFRSSAIEKSHLRLGEGHAGRAALEGRTFNVPDLRIVGSAYARSKLLAGEEFVAYFGVPLVTKGKVIGVFEIFNRSPLVPDPEWLDFMEALASQAAIAIDSATLFNDLQRSNVELSLAYDTTIEGLSHALDLRDKETEGHSKRVTEMTVDLARAMDMSEAELTQIRHGALLHDIGKMGVPDSILLKPGPLTDEEWVIMQQHPRHAFDILSPIAFLGQALDIPYCHHEKWDGTGYPRGLKGEQIPIAARLFAVVDVWDALLSDRPYRKPWSKVNALAYIREQAGVQFDPRVVDIFQGEIGTFKEIPCDSS